MSEDRKTTRASSEAVPVIGAKLLREVTTKKPNDSYQPNGLPPIDEGRHSPEVIASLQKRAMQLD